MSEPKAIAQRARRIIPGLFHLTVHDDRIDSRSDAYAITTRRGTVLIDPLPMTDGALRSLGEVMAICLTIQSHQRASWRLRKQLAVPVHAPEGAMGLEEEPDGFFEDGDELPGKLRAMHAPGPAHEGYVLVRDRTRGGAIAFIGDSLIRSRSGSLGFVPDVYMDDPERARESARRLFAMSIGVLCPGHGAPMVGGVRNAIWRALERDEAKRARGAELQVGV